MDNLVQKSLLMLTLPTPRFSPTPKVRLDRNSGLVARAAFAAAELYPERFRRLIAFSAGAVCLFMTDTATAALPGDINRDGRVSFADYQILQQNYNQPGGPDQGDQNGDGRVSFVDFQLLQQNYNRTSPPPQLVQLNAIEEPEPGDILHIAGAGFAPHPDDNCALLVGPGGRFIGIETLVTDGSNFFGATPFIPPQLADVPLQLMIAVGNGRRVQIQPDFDDVIVPADQWVWRNFPLAIPPVGRLANPIVVSPIPCPGFHSEPPTNGTLCVIIDADWAAGTTVCIEGRVERADANMMDTRIKDVVFTGTGTRFDCAVRICDLIEKMFAAHPDRPLDLICTVTPEGANSKINLRSADGVAIIGGNIDICFKPNPPVIAAVFPQTNVLAGDVLQIQGRNLPDKPDDACVLLAGQNGHQIPMEALLADGNVIHARIPAIGDDDMQHAPFVLMIGRGIGIRPKIRPQIPDVIFDANPWLWKGAIANMAVGPQIQVNPGPLLPPFVRCFNSGPPVGGVLCLFLDEDWGPNTVICLSARILKQQDEGCDTGWDNIKFTAGGSKLACAAKICEILKQEFKSRGRPVLCSITDMGNTVKITLRCASEAPIIGGHIRVYRKRPPIIIADLMIPPQPQAGDLVRLVGQNLPDDADDHCWVMEAEDGQQIPIDILDIGVQGEQVVLDGRIPFVPADAEGKAFMVKIGAGRGIRRPIQPEFGDVEVVRDPWMWAGENADMAAWPQLVNPVFVAVANPCFTSEPPQDGKICLIVDGNWPATNNLVRLGARIHKPCDKGHDINFEECRFIGGGTRFDCAVRICDLLKKAFEARGRGVRCNVTADESGNAKITLQCTGPEKLNAGYIKVEIVQ